MFYLCSNNFYYFMLYHSSALEFIIERYISIVYYYYYYYYYYFGVYFYLIFVFRNFTKLLFSYIKKNNTKLSSIIDSWEFLEKVLQLILFWLG